MLGFPFVAHLTRQRHCYSGTAIRPSELIRTALAGTRSLIAPAAREAAFAEFYGQETGQRLAGLLTIHIQQAVPVLQAAQAGDRAALDRALADWYANANKIANFLSSLNLNNWPRSQMEEIWRVHIDQTTTYSVDVLNRDYVAAVRDYDRAFDHMMGLADLLSAGIIAQFPKRFAR